MIAASKRKWRQIALTFVGDAKGAIAPLFALIAVPVLGIAMTAYDYNRAEGMRAKLQVAVDNAAAAAAQRLDEPYDDIDLAVRNFLKANLTKDLQGLPHETIIASENSAITLKMKTRVRTTLLSLVGFRQIDIAVAATVKRPALAETAPQPTKDSPQKDLSPQDLQKRFNLDHAPSESEIREAEAKVQEILRELQSSGDLPPELSQLLH